MPLAVLVCAVLLTLAPPQSLAPPAPDLRNLRWVHGVVAAATPESITLTLQDRELTLSRDALTEIVDVGTRGLTAGSMVEAHYWDRRGAPRAIVVVTGIGPAELSKRPKSSLRGTVTKMRRGTLTVQAGGKTRALSVNKGARLLDREGLMVATGSADIGRLLPATTEVLIKYESESDIQAGDVTLFGGNDKALEIRRLR